MSFLGADTYGQSHSYNPGNVGANSIPFAPSISTTFERAQFLYTPGQFTPTLVAGTITSVYFRSSTATSTTATYNNFTVKLGNTALTGLPAGGSAWTGGLTTVYSSTSATLTTPSNGWVALTLQTPFSYNGVDNLIIDISSTGSTNSFTIAQTSQTTNRRTWGTSASTVTSGADLLVMHFGVDILTQPCAGQPNALNITTPVQTGPVCAGNTFSLTAANPNTPATGYVYQWQQGTSATGPWTNVATGGTALSYTTTALTATTYYRVNVVCTNSTLSASSAAYQVLVASPQLTSNTPAARCGPGSVTLDAMPTAGDSIRWYASTTATTPLWVGNSFTTPSLTATTTYYVQAFRGACQSARTAVVATINSFPNVTVTAGGSTNFCAGQSVKLSVPAQANQTYQWSNNGSQVTGATADSLIVTTAGSWTVQVINTLTGCTATSAATVTQLNPPQALVSPANALSICPGTTTTLTTQSAPGLTYQWRLNGNPINNATNNTYTTGTGGSYSVTVSNGPSCVGTTPNPTVLTLYTPPTAAVTATQGTAVCQGSQLPLNANLGNNLTYQWVVGTSNIAGATNPVYNATAAGSYAVRVTSTTTGCSTLSAPVVVTVNQLPTATAAISGPAAQCDSVKILANTGTNLSYQWLLAGADIPLASSATYAARTSGSYSVRVTNTATGCSQTSGAVTATIFPPAPAYITYNSPLRFCEGSAIVLTAPPSTLTNSYVWSLNGSPVSGDTLNYSIASLTGIYTLKVTNSFGCVGYSQPVPVTVDPAPTPAITRNGLVLSTGTYIAYQWFRNNIAIAGATNQTYTVTQPGSYRVEVMDQNGCQGASTSMYFNTTSVPGTMAKEAIRIFPNPATDVVFIEASETINVRLRDAVGRSVYEGTAVKQVPVGNLAPGLYHLVVTDKDGKLLTTERIVKAK